jgi:hypothetical protein
MVCNACCGARCGARGAGRMNVARECWIASVLPDAVERLVRALTE